MPFSMSLTGVPSALVARCKHWSRVVNSISTSSGVSPRDSRVAVPSRMVSTMSLSPYGPMASAKGPTANGEVLDMHSFFVLRSMSNWCISSGSVTVSHEVDPSSLTFGTRSVCTAPCACGFMYHRNFLAIWRDASHNCICRRAISFVHPKLLAYLSARSLRCWSLMVMLSF